MLEMRETGMVSKAWPFDEARRILKRYEKAPPDKGYVLFETGYGPSGLPHIGTCLLYTSPSPRDATLSRMPSSA